MRKKTIRIRVVTVRRERVEPPPPESSWGTPQPEATVEDATTEPDTPPDPESRPGLPARLLRRVTTVFAFLALALPAVAQRGSDRAEFEIAQDGGQEDSSNAKLVTSLNFPPQVDGSSNVTVSRTAGNNPFVAYAVVNDGGSPGQRSRDGAFLVMDTGN